MKPYPHQDIDDLKQEQKTTTKSLTTLTDALDILTTELHEQRKITQDLREGMRVLSEENKTHRHKIAALRAELTKQRKSNAKTD